MKWTAVNKIGQFCFLQFLVSKIICYVTMCELLFCIAIIESLYSYRATALAGTWPLRPLSSIPGAMSANSANQEMTRGRMANHYSVDCSHATTGLFCGLLIMASVLISLIVFFTLTKENLMEPAIIIAQYSQLILYIISIIAVLLAMQRVRKDQSTYPQKFPTWVYT